MSWKRPYTVVDSHCHAGLRKYEPIEALLDQMFRNGVDQAILIQHMGEYDNRYLSESSQRFPGRFAVAALVDVADPEAPQKLARWAEWPWVKGLRLVCTDPEPLWQKLDELGMATTLRGTLAELASAETRRRIQRYERVSFCVEHLGEPDPTEAPPYSTYRKMLSLAELPNVYMKVSTWPGRAAGPDADLVVKPFAGLALEAFGPRRLMWGSNYPPVSTQEGYGNTLAVAESLFPGLSTEERAWLMGKAAQQVWGLGVIG